MIQTIIIDDNKEAADNLAQHLKKYTHIKVTGVAYNGTDGLALVSKQKPALLFLDIELPDISGLDFLDRLDNETLGLCQVVVYTAYDAYILPAFRKRVFDVLLKPIDEKDLEGILQRVKTCQEEKAKQAIDKRSNNKLLFYTNTQDFRLVDKKDIGLFQYNHEVRCWEVIVAGSKSPIKLKRNVKSSMLVALDDHFIQVNQKFIINLNYLIEVVDNVCSFYPPFDQLDYVKVGCWYRRKLIDRFYSL